MRLAIISSPWSWPMTRWPRMSASLSTVSISSFDHAADRDAGPVRDDRGDRLLVDDARRSAAFPDRSSSELARACRAAARRRPRLGVAASRRRGGGSAACAAALRRGCARPSTRRGRASRASRAAPGSSSTSAFSVVQSRFELGERSRSAPRASRRSRRRARSSSTPRSPLAADDLELGLAAPRSRLRLSSTAGRRRRAG